MGASRVRYAKDLYLFGLLRQSDWLPVGGNEQNEHTVRSNDSISDSEDRFSVDSDNTDANSSAALSFGFDEHSEDETFHDLLSSLDTEAPGKADWDVLFD